MKKLFALILCLFCSAQLWAKDYQVADFGVVADGTTLNTRAIQRAIDLIHEQGGGRLVFRWVVICRGRCICVQG